MQGPFCYLKPHLDVHPVDGAEHISGRDATRGSGPPGAHSGDVPYAVVIALELHSHPTLFYLQVVADCRHPRRRW